MHENIGIYTQCKCLRSSIVNIYWHTFARNNSHLKQRAHIPSRQFVNSHNIQFVNMNKPDSQTQFDWMNAHSNIFLFFHNSCLPYVTLTALTKINTQCYKGKFQCMKMQAYTHNASVYVTVLLTYIGTHLPETTVI